VFQQLIHKISLFFSTERESYLIFYSILGFYPKNISYYKQALMHKSFSKLTDKGRPINNERLEFLGDAILDAVVGDIVFKHFKGKHEGFLTNTRSKIVQRETLNKLAVQIGLDKLVQYHTHSSSHNNYMYGNAFEALIGAIYLDQGYDKCMEFFSEKIVKKYIDLDKMAYKEMNFKSRLIEWSQKNKIDVSFELVRQDMDMNNNPVFRTEILIEGFMAGVGTGYSKKESQQNAAQTALKRLKSDKNFYREILATRDARANREDFVETSEEVTVTESVITRTSTEADA